jgi:hypothetical protein
MQAGVCLVSLGYADGNVYTICLNDHIFINGRRRADIYRVVASQDMSLASRPTSTRGALVAQGAEPRVR